MRELKFRAWDAVDKRYYYWSIEACFAVGASAGCMEKYTFEQYTGLKDKNGKKIYEGDIVNAVGIGIAQVIDSPSGEWMLYYKREPDEIKNGFACVVPRNKPNGLWKTNITSYIDVIGNIHENPELLEEEE